MIGEDFTFILEYMRIAGFLETRASLGIDIVVTFLAFLPLLSILSIFLVIKKYLKMHQVTQLLLFFLTMILLGLFAYIVHYEEGLATLIQKSSIDKIKVYTLLILHAFISIGTLTIWLFALFYALSDRKRRALPGVYSASHAKAGKRIFKGIVLMALTSTGIYWVLFIA